MVVKQGIERDDDVTFYKLSEKEERHTVVTEVED